MKTPEPLPPAPAADPLPTWLSVAEAAAVWRCSAKAVYGAIRSGQVRHRRIGAVIRIPASEVLTAEVHRPPGKIGGGK